MGVEKSSHPATLSLYLGVNAPQVAISAPREVRNSFERNKSIQLCCRPMEVVSEISVQKRSFLIFSGSFWQTQFRYR